MKKLFIYFYLIICFYPCDLKAQNNSEIAGIAAGVATAGIAIGIAAEQINEQLELKATEYLLKNYPELKQFSLKILRFNGKKLSDISPTSLIIFKVREFNINSHGKEEFIEDKKKALFAFTSHGWINNNGVNYNRIKWEIVDKDEWLNMMVAYLKLASNENDSSKLKSALLVGRITKKGIREQIEWGENVDIYPDNRKKVKIDFYSLKGDSYIVTEYSSNYKFIYNEASLGIFINETGDLVQIGRNDITEIHNFFTTKEEDIN